MNLIIKKELFSIQDAYDIFDENNIIKYHIKKEFFSMVRMLRIYDGNGTELAIVKRVFTSLMPKYNIEIDKKVIGSIKKELTFFKPKYSINYKGYTANGDLMNFNFNVLDKSSNIVASIKRIHFKTSSTCEIDIINQSDELDIVLLAVVLEDMRVQNRTRRRK